MSGGKKPTYKCDLFSGDNCWLRHAVVNWISSFYKANCPANLNLLNCEELYLHCEYTKSVIETMDSKSEYTN